MNDNINTTPLECVIDMPDINLDINKIIVPDELIGKEFKDMTYGELQSVCKLNGLRANIKQSEMLEIIAKINRNEMVDIHYYKKEYQETILQKHQKKILIIGAIIAVLIIIGILIVLFDLTVLPSS